jgi:hypothetical protein
VGLVITIGLIVACYFLFRSFLTHLRRVPASFDEPADRAGAPDALDPTDVPAARIRPKDRDR